MAFFLNIDFESHVALVAQIDEDGRPAIAGGGRYIVVRPGQAEIAFVVVDAYQGQGIGSTSHAPSGYFGARRQASRN